MKTRLMTKTAPTPVNPALKKGRSFVLRPGISVTLDDRIFFYMGDTWGCPSLNHCFARDNLLHTTTSIECAQNDTACEHYKASKACNDAIIFTAKPSEAELIDDWSGALEDMYLTIPQTRLLDTDTALGFTPLLIDGVNKRGTIDTTNATLDEHFQTEMGIFNTPTGAGKMSINGVDTIVVWYASGGNLPGEPEKSHSWLGCSTDGMDFSRCPGFDDDYFSQEKFMHVAPVPVSATEIENLCGIPTNSQTMCNLKMSLGGAKNGLLVYASGAPYRCGDLHLGFLYETSPGNDLDMLYYNDGGWSVDEADATPLIQPVVCEGIPAGIFEAQWDPISPKNAFGEISADQVEIDGSTYIVLLSSHNAFFSKDTSAGVTQCLEGNPPVFGDVNNCIVGTPIQMRLIKLWDPGNPSNPRDTTGDGYGPYIIREFTRVDSVDTSSAEIQLAHVLSAWKGGNTLKFNKLSSASTCWGGTTYGKSLADPLGQIQDEPYGVFVRSLELEDGMGGRLPTRADFSF